MSTASAKNARKRKTPVIKSPTVRTKPRLRADKLSISLSIDDVQWATRRAKHLGTSVSAVIAAALADQRRADARDTLLELLGKDDITDADIEAARVEAFGK